MVFDEGFRGAAAVFCGRGAGEMPFCVGSAGCEGNVVEVDYLVFMNWHNLSNTTTAEGRVLRKRIIL